MFETTTQLFFSIKTTIHLKIHLINQQISRGQVLETTGNMLFSHGTGW